jgi:hypothetical protein
METISKASNNTGKGYKRLTINEFKRCKGFENYSDEQAEKTILTLEKLSTLFYDLNAKHTTTEKHLKQLKQNRLYEEHRTAA